MSLLRNTNFKTIVCDALAESIMDVLTGFDFLVTDGEMYRVQEAGLMNSSYNGEKIFTVHAKKEE